MRIIRLGIFAAIAVALALLGLNLEVVQKKLFYPLFYEKEIKTYADKNKLDPVLVAAIIHNESNFKPEAVSSRGAVGIMQIMPETGAWIAKEMGVKSFKEENLKEPAASIRMGCWYLSELKYQFENDITAIAAYNAGRGTVESWLEEKKWDGVTVAKIPFAETSKYVERVLADREKYRILYRETWQKPQ